MYCIEIIIMESTTQNTYDNETTEQYIARISTGKQTISFDEYMNRRD